MAAVPVPRTWVDDEFVTAGIMNGTTGVKGPLDFLLTPKKCAVYQTSSQSLTTSGTAYAISWDAEHYDNDGMWSASAPTRITIQTDGLYHFDAVVAFGSNASGYRELEIRKNGVAVRPRARDLPVSGVNHLVRASGDLDLLAGDYLEVFAIQVTSPTTTLGTVSGLTWTNFMIHRVGS